MKTLVVFPSQKAVRVVEAPRPEGPLSAKQVLLRTIDVGICGTDREIAAFAYGESPPGQDHLVLGHESIAEVLEVGAKVRGLRPGMLVVPTVRRPCGDASCVACGADRPDFCVTGRFRERGIKEADGFLCELFVEDESNLVRVPRALADVGVLVEPLTIVAKTQSQIRAIQGRLPWEGSSRRALVLGAGAVGLLAAMMLVANDLDTYVYSREPPDGDRAKLIRGFGATYVSATDVDVASLGSRVGSVDVVFEAIGSSPVVFAATSVLAPNGIFVFTGVPSLGLKRSVDLDGIMRDLVLKNQVFLGTVNASRRAYETAITELEQFLGLFPASVRALIGHRTSIDEAPELLRAQRGIKDVVHFGRT